MINNFSFYRPKRRCSFMQMMSQLQVNKEFLVYDFND